MDRPAILIDNGSYQCRAGFETSEEPTLVFKNLIAKLRKERAKKELDLQVGNEIENLDAVRFALRSAFDRNVVVNYDIQEAVFDYIFSTLQVDGENVEHPVLLTEAFLNPAYSRNLMSELLFECYQVPGVSYGVDSLFSFHQNYPDVKNSLIISLGNQTIHVIPLVNGQIQPGKSKRINLGGSSITTYLHKLLQLKYPSHINTVTLGKVEDILHTDGYIALDYFEELKKWNSLEYYTTNVLRIPIKAQSNVIQSSEALKERRKEIARKMVEMNARKREEKLVEFEEQLNILNQIKIQVRESNDPLEVQQALTDGGINSISELMKTIMGLKNRISKIKQKIQETSNSGSTTAAAANTTTSTSNESPKPKNLKLLEYPSEKEKFYEWLNDIRSKRCEILKKQGQRRQKRTDMTKRRSLVQREKMIILTQLSAAADKKEKDTFGMEDKDWNVYKDILKDGGSDTEDEQDELTDLEITLKKHDPSFISEQDMELKSNLEENELHVGLEKVRCPEIIFQPSMIGLEQCGVIETIENVLKLYPNSSEIQNNLVQNIFITGGPSKYNGLLSRLEKDLMAIRPFQSTFQVNFAQNPILDSWKGMKLWMGNIDNRKYFVTKSEYLEFGGEYFKQSDMSNAVYSPIPAAEPI